MSSLSRVSAFARLNGAAGVMFAFAVFFAPAAFAQTSPEDEVVDLSGVADLVNLLRMVVDPSPSPVLSSPAERAVSGQAVPSASVTTGPRVVTVRPTVILPDIVLPEEETDAPDAVAVEPERKEAEPPVAKSLPRASSADAVPDADPPFYYVFFYGDYVPYFNGWFYYSDAWFWGRRGPRPLEPPGWIPPPPPPDRPVRPGPGPRPGSGAALRGGGSRTTTSGSTQTIIIPKSSGGSSPVVAPGTRRIIRQSGR